MSSAEDFPIRDESALSSGSQLEEPTSQDSSDASEEYSCLGTATGQLTAVQEFSCQTVVTTSDLAPDGKRIEEESMINLHSDSLSNAFFLLPNTVQVIIYILTQTQKLVRLRVR